MDVYVLDSKWRDKTIEFTMMYIFCGTLDHGYRLSIAVHSTKCLWNNIIDKLKTGRHGNMEF